MRSIQAPGEKQHHSPYPVLPPVEVASSTVEATAAATAAPPVALCALASESSTNGCVHDPELGIVDLLEGAMPEKTSCTAAEALPTVQGDAAALQQVKRILAEREAEVQALKTQLQQLTVGPTT